jgi:hypothetical protein
VWTTKSIGIEKYMYLHIVEHRDVIADENWKNCRYVCVDSDRHGDRGKIQLKSNLQRWTRQIVMTPENS